MKNSTLIFITLATGFVASLAALYVAYVIVQKKISDSTAANPTLAAGLGLLNKL